MQGCSMWCQHHLIAEELTQSSIKKAISRKRWLFCALMMKLVELSSLHILVLTVLSHLF